MNRNTKSGSFHKTSQPNAEQKRIAKILRSFPPITVILVCAFELLGLILLPQAVLEESSQAIGVWYQGYIVITGILTVYVIWKLWKMKKSGLYVYFSTYIAHNIIALIVGNWLIYVLIIPIVGAVLLLPHIKKMS